MPRFTSITLSILLLSGMLLTATSPVALALSAVEIQKLLASDGVASDRFGNSVSVDGNRVLIGTGRVNGFASAYVFEWDGFYWVERAQLIASDAAAGDRFAFQVTLSGDTALVGAINDDDNGNDSGSVYAFVWDGISWNEQAKLTASDGAAFDYFGRSVFLDGNTALIGAFGDDDKGSFSGAVYVFERTGGVWTEQAKLVASDGAAGDRVGPRGSVAIDGDIALIGSYSDDDNGTNSGSVYVFERNGNVWTEQSRITASDGAAGDGFGRSLAYSGNTAMISAPFDDGVTGSVYVFERDGSNWNEVDKLTATDGSGLDAFGFPVALDGDTAVIGATDDDDNGSSSGSAYIFQLNGGVWTEQAKLTASDAAVLDRFGEGASISGDNVHIGALFDDDFGSESGSVYAFIIDSDDDGIRDSADNCSKNINPDQADVDQDGLGDVCDPDDDNDNVPDSYDICPATEIPESVPQVSLKPNRWALLDNDVEFDTTKKGKRWVTSRNYSTTDTAGCSCDQIIAELGLGHGHMKYGCSIGAMEYWVELVGQ